MKKIQTVKKLINPEELGFTLMHEHCLIIGESWFEPNPEIDKKTANGKISLKNYGDIVYNPFSYKDNLNLTDINVPIEELKEYKNLGGGSLVDVTLECIGRNPESLKYISEESGINIIMGAGRFIESSLKNENKKKSIKDLSREIIDEFEKGVKQTAVKPGIIGEIGIEIINNRYEMQNLLAAVIAQKKIGCALCIHPPLWEKRNHEILDILQEQKVDINKVIFSHCDPTLNDFEYHDSLVKRGAYIEFDQFGMQVNIPGGGFLPSDGERINAISKQIKMGNIDRVLISGDTFMKISFKKWGGWGFTHILKNIIPRMKTIGISQGEINKIVTENPMDVLSF